MTAVGRRGSRLAPLALQPVERARSTAPGTWPAGVLARPAHVQHAAGRGSSRQAALQLVHGDLRHAASGRPASAQARTPPSR